MTGHTISGVPCILAGLNRHDGDLTMPSHFKVADVLDRDWIRMATKEEKAQHGKWYHVLSFKPATVIYNNGTCAGPHDPLGLFGHYITVHAQEPVDTSKYFRCADVDDIRWISEDRLFVSCDGCMMVDDKDIAMTKRGRWR